MSTARVTAIHRSLLRLRTDDGREVAARLPRGEQSVVCGDRVRCEFDERHAELRVVGIDPRSGTLYRTNARGGGELIAANLSLLLVVCAPLPRVDFFLLDRYLCAAHCAGLQAAVLVNKAELEFDQAAEQELRAYAAAGYRCLRVSAQRGDGLAALAQMLQAHSAILVGQSGVGKSSLLRALVPDAAAPIGALIRDDEGRHTTTGTQLYPLPGGGELLDSPGVRDFAPAVDRLEVAALGFPEIEALAPQCRFADCRHLQEPDCAVRAAAGSDGGPISARRYESYRRLRRLYERLSALRSGADVRRRR
jgi:ribosome biogenesis GTPase